MGIVNRLVDNDDENIIRKLVSGGIKCVSFIPS